LSSRPIDTSAEYDDTSQFGLQNRFAERFELDAPADPKADRKLSVGDDSVLDSRVVEFGSGHKTWPPLKGVNEQRSAAVVQQISECLIHRWSLDELGDQRCSD
jgi:hypothetical protein